MKAKVPSKLPALTFTMLGKGYVDVGADLALGLTHGNFLNLHAFKPKQVGYFDVLHDGRFLRFKVYKPGARNGAHTRLTLEKEVVRSLGLVAGDSLIFDFPVSGGITLDVDRTGHVSGVVAKKLLKPQCCPKAKGPNKSSCWKSFRLEIRQVSKGCGLGSWACARNLRTLQENCTIFRARWAAVSGDPSHLLSS